MSSKGKKSYRDLSTPKNKSTTISYKDSVSIINTQSAIMPYSLIFELKLFAMTTSTLLSTSIYINKGYLNNYNFKLMILLTFYFLRRLLFQVYYHFHIKQYLIYTVNYSLMLLFVLMILIDIAYVFYDLIINYSIYSLLPLFYFTIFQLPIFIFDSDKRYEHPPKELIHIIKKILYLSLEVCYYAIFIPVFFAVKNSPFFNAFAIYLYTFFAWVNAFMFLFAFNYFKKSAEFHFYTTSAGNWKKITKKEMTPEQFATIKVWASLQHYEKNDVVEYKGKYYVGLEEKNYVEPNNFYMGILYRMFIEPKEFFKKIVFVQGMLTMIQGLIYLLTQFNVFSINLMIWGWYVFYEIYEMNGKMKEIFKNKKISI